MIFKLVFAISLASITLTTAQTMDEFLLSFQQLFPNFNSVNFWDQPTSVSSAPIPTPTATIKPTVAQLWYYSNYAAVNCPTFLFGFNCTSCDEIKNDISEYKLVYSSVTSFHGLVAVSDKRKEIVVSYRGTRLPMDFLLDVALINATPVEDCNIKVHAGFYIAAMSVYQQVLDAVGCQLAKNPTYKIVLTGISLGGAVARITSFFFLYLKQFPNVPIEVYTYGEPRSGNQFYADFLNSQPIVTARVVSNSDIVPHLPPTSILGTTILSDYYVHALTEYWLNATNGGVFCGQSAYEDASCSNSIGPAYNPLDHSTFLGFSTAQCLNDTLNIEQLPLTLPLFGAPPPLPIFTKVSDDCGFGTDWQGIVGVIG